MAFYRTKVTIDVLSHKPFGGFESLSDLDYEITYGSCSGKVTIGESKELTHRQLINACNEHGTDPGFFLEAEAEFDDDDDDDYTEDDES